MRPSRQIAFCLTLCLALSVLSTGRARGATYLPLSDEALARRSPVIVRAQVIGQETRVATIDGGDDRRFAVRPVFRAGEDDVLSQRPIDMTRGGAAGRTLREAESFAVSLRSVRPGEEFLPVSCSAPDGEPRAPQTLTPAWANLGG